MRILSSGSRAALAKKWPRSKLKSDHTIRLTLCTGRGELVRGPGYWLRSPGQADAIVTEQVSVHQVPTLGNIQRRSDNEQRRSTRRGAGRSRGNASVGLTKEDIGIEQQQNEIVRCKHFALNCLSWKFTEMITITNEVIPENLVVVR